MVLYGISGTLFAYCIALGTTTPLAAFAATAGYGVLIFLVRLSSNKNLTGINPHCLAVPCRLLVDFDLCKNIAGIGHSGYYPLDWRSAQSCVQLGQFLASKRFHRCIDCIKLRAAFVSVNMFSLLCDGSNVVTTADEAALRRFVV